MGTKTNPGKFDCYKAAKDDEPIFVLLARDPLAPAVVRFWAAMKEDFEAQNQNSPKPIETAKTIEARKCAADMQEWKIKNLDV